MNKLKVALLFSFTLVLFGCGANRTASTSAPAVLSGGYSEYQIGIGDELNVNVWRNPELTLVVPVRPDGKISMPLVGDVEAAGRSAAELSEALRTELINFIRNPQVAVIVTNATSTDYQNRVRVTGAIDTPLSIAHREGMTVLDLVLEAGGLTEFAVANRTILYRKTGEGVKSYSVKLGDILNKGRLDTNYPLAPSDIISVPERSF